VVKNVSKISVWAWFAFVFFVFGCGSEAEKERVRLEKEKEIAKEDSIRRLKEKDSIRRENKKKQREMLTVDVKPISAADSLHIACKKDKVCRKRASDSIKQALIKCKKEGSLFCPIERIEEMKFYISEYE